VSVWKRLEAERGRKSLERGKRVGYQEVLEALIEGHLPLA
jgi:hypothetical protein